MDILKIKEAMYIYAYLTREKIHTKIFNTSWMKHTHANMTG